MTVAYDGARFRGFALNPGVPTVAGALSSALERVLRCPVQLMGAGRTDAGVHAWGQVVSFDAPTGVDLARVQRSVNALCGPAVVVRAAEVVADDFDARFSARWRRYRYTILNREAPDPFLARTCWHVPAPLALASMRLAVDPLIGEHDFTTFCRRPRPGDGGPPPSLVRHVLDAGWDVTGEGVLCFEIRANAFCHQMVRSIVGLMIDVGRQRRRAGEVRGLLAARDRGGVTTVAPPHGLCLWEVGY